MAKTKKQTRKQSIPIGPEPITKRPPEQKSAEATPQDIANGFDDYAKNITKTANNFACRQSDPELTRLYITYRQLIGTHLEFVKKHFPEGSKLDELPALKDNVLLGMFALADYCKGCAAALRNKPTTTDNGGGENQRPAKDESVTGSQTEQEQKEYEIIVGKGVCNRGQSVKLLEKLVADTAREGVPCTERTSKSFRKYFKGKGYENMVKECHWHKGKIHTNILVGKLSIKVNK